MKTNHIIFGLITFIILVAIIFSRARAAWVGIIVALPLFFWMIRRGK